MLTVTNASGFGSGGAGPYAITNSCTFNGSDEKMTRTWSASPTANDIWTFSAWVERDALGVDGVFGPRIQGSRNANLDFKSDNTITLYNDNSTHVTAVTTNNTYATGWLHVFVSMELGRSPHSLKVFINGVEPTYSSSYDQGSSGYAMNHASTIMDLGTNRHATFAGQIAEFIWIDGSAISLSSVYDSGSPVDPSGLTFGDDGCHLNFADSSDLGKDVSGNGNDFTLTNIDASNQSTNVP